MTAFTYEQLINFENFAVSYFNKDVKNQDTKFGYALLKVLKSPEYTSAKRDFQNGNKEIGDEVKLVVEELEIDLCQVDKDGSIIYDNTTDKDGKVHKAYRFTKDAMKKRNREISKLKNIYEKKLFDYYDIAMKKEYEIRPYFATLVPNGLTESELEVLKGIVINSEFSYASENGLSVVSNTVSMED